MKKEGPLSGQSQGPWRTVDWGVSLGGKESVGANQRMCPSPPLGQGAACNICLEGLEGLLILPRCHLQVGVFIVFLPLIAYWVCLWEQVTYLISEASPPKGGTSKLAREVLVLMHGSWTLSSEWHLEGSLTLSLSGRVSVRLRAQGKELHVWCTAYRWWWIIFLFTKYCGTLLCRASPCGERALHPDPLVFSVTI